MMWIVSILFIAPVVHSYVLYPLSLRLLAALRKNGSKSGDDQAAGHRPKLSLLIAARNEAAVLPGKFQSIVDSNYPLTDLEVLIGSDASTDATAALVDEWQERFPSFRLIEFSERQGKSAILNALALEARYDWLVCTDANVLHDPDCFDELVLKAQRQGADAVGAEIRYMEHAAAPVASDEDRFLRFENRLKRNESKCWEAVMGLEGSCYLIRKASMPELPVSAIVDDFYVGMSVLLAGGKVLWNQDALAFEEVSRSEAEEYRRKVRISKGNFQNLKWFLSRVLSRGGPAAYAFISHKVFRWLTPVFLLGSTVALSVELLRSEVPSAILWSLGYAILLLFLPLARRLPLLRSIRHWLLMNIALLHGLILHIRNKGGYVWEPTNRDQKGI